MTRQVEVIRRSFPPQRIAFDPASHTYSDACGRRVHSVTQVLSGAGLVDFGRLSGEVLAEKAALGSAVHMAGQYYDEGTLDESTVDPAIRGYLDAWLRFRGESGFEPLLIEHLVYHPIHCYAGTLDRAGRLAGGDHAVLDIKTGGDLPAHALQLAAYSEAVMGDYLDTWTSSVPRRLVVRLQGDGKYRVREYPRETYRRDLDVFLAALAVYRWRMDHGLQATT